MNLTVTIESAELRFKQILEEYFIAVYSNNSLISHGIDHHRRVWNYAKKVTLLLNEHKQIDDPFFPYRLIIACYLHDIGMSIDHGPIHGHHGRDICISFLAENNLNESDYSDVLQAIENHDNKEYNNSSGTYDLLTILSIADDLDAFGFIGIYRYIEIYLVRGIKPYELGHLIINNARKRFKNFTESVLFQDDFIAIHKKRFDILEDFFKEYNKQVSYYQFGDTNAKGYCGVADTVLCLIKNQMVLKDLFGKTAKYSSDPVIKWFYDELEYELSFSN
jgi:hypothetical protein